MRRTFGDEYAAYCARVNRWLPRRMWHHFASVALLVYAAGSVVHLLNLAGFLPIEQMPTLMHGMILGLAGYSGVGFVAGAGRVLFKHVADALVYGLIATHLIVSAILHAYSIAFATNAWIDVLPRWYSFLALAYFSAFAYYCFQLQRRLNRMAGRQ